MKIEKTCRTSSRRAEVREIMGDARVVGGEKASAQRFENNVECGGGCWCASQKMRKSISNPREMKHDSGDEGGMKTEAANREERITVRLGGPDGSREGHKQFKFPSIQVRAWLRCGKGVKRIATCESERAERKVRE